MRSKRIRLSAGSPRDLGTGSHIAILVGLTLLAGGLFKVAGFAREAFIATRYGVSEITDTYFGLQQFPLALATFMFGAFALAFTPAYADAKRNASTVKWLRGLLFYGCLIGALLTLTMLASAPVLLKMFVRSGRSEAWGTLAILSPCFAPIVCIGIWSGICTARGSSISAMTMTGFPYLVMTVAIVLLHLAGALGSQSLALSMATGFVLVGIYALLRILWAQPGFARTDVLMPWRHSDFRRFVRQLAASSLENIAFVANQFFILYFLSRAGTGAISANNYAMRVGMLGYSLFAQPLAQLMQARICLVERVERTSTFRRWLLILAVGIAAIASAVFFFRLTVIRIVYMRGSFTETELKTVAAILPAWVGYVVVLSVNAFLARYLFTTSRGATYVRYMIPAYIAANLLRFVVPTTAGTSWIIWCSVITEGFAMLISLRTCLRERKDSKLIPLPSTQEVCS